MITTVKNEKHNWEFKTIPIGKKHFKVLRNGEDRGLVEIRSKNGKKVQSEELWHKGVRKNYNKLNYNITTDDSRHIR